MKYVIIGNSTAAVAAIEGIRKTDREGSITVVSAEKYHNYSRPLISYYLQGKTDLAHMYYRPDSFYDENGCICIYNNKVVKISANNKSVVLDGGEKLSYDKLLVATGSSPFVPPVKGLDSVEKKFTFMSLGDAEALGAALDESSRVLILGAGLIGLKCAEGISGRCGSITVVDMADRVLPSVLDDTASAMVKSHLEGKGIHFILGQSAASFEGNTAVLSSGERLGFDILVIAVGVRPNVSLLSDIGGSVDRGIVTDEYMCTSIPDIYAAGDCTESFDVSSETQHILALLPNACRQGECAGTNMSGGKMKFDKAIPMNAAGFLGLHIITAGTYTGDSYVSRSKSGYKKLFYSDGVLKGCILAGDVDKAGIYTYLIQNRVPLHDIDFELICEKPSLMAFSYKYRKEKLGGVHCDN